MPRSRPHRPLPQPRSLLSTTLFWTAPESVSEDLLHRLDREPPTAAGCWSATDRRRTETSLRHSLTVGLDGGQRSTAIDGRTPSIARSVGADVVAPRWLLERLDPGSD